MLNFYKLIEIIVSLQLLIISTMIPVYITIPFVEQSIINLEMPITWQIPTIILLTLIFNRKVVITAFTIYITIGLFVTPVFHQGGSLGYMLTPNFGYLIGTYPLIKIIGNLNKKSKLTTSNFLISNICNAYNRTILQPYTINILQSIYIIYI